MEYRSKDIEYMTELKTNVFNMAQESPEAQKAWEYMRRYIVVEDLRAYVNLNGNLGYVAEFNKNTNYMDIEYLFVTLTNSPSELKLFNKFLAAANVESIYRTSYTRFSKNAIKYSNVLGTALTSEIKTVKPKKVMIFGMDIVKSMGIEASLHHPFEINGIPAIATSSMIGAIVHPDTSQQVKNNMWRDFLCLKKL